MDLGEVGHGMKLAQDHVQWKVLVVQKSYEPFSRQKMCLSVAEKTSRHIKLSAIRTWKVMGGHLNPRSFAKYSGHRIPVPKG